MSHKIITQISLICFVCLGLMQSNLSNDDLSSIYQQALQSDPLLREAEANRLATNEAKAQALSGLLPQLSANANYNQTDSKGISVGEFIPEGSRPNDDSNTSNSWNIQLQQSIFDWNRWIGLKRADKTVLKSGLDFEVAKQDLILRVARSYFAVLAAEDVLKFEQASKEAIARQLDQTDTRFEVGLVAITDVHEAQAAYDQAIASEIDAKRQLALAKGNLREITGLKVTELATPKADMLLGPPIPESEEDWVNLSLDQNLDLLSARMSAQIARDDIRSQKTGHYPTVGLSLSRSGSDSDRDDFTQVNPQDVNSTGSSNSTSLGVQLNVPIYSGGQTRSQVRQSVFQHRAAIERVERITRETERATRDAYLNVLANVSRIRALKQAVRSSQTALKATETGFEVGTRTTVDVLNSRRTLLDSERNYSQSRYDYLSNLLSLKRAAGTLNQADIDEINLLLE